MKPNNWIGFKADSEDTIGVVTFVSSVFLSFPNLNPRIGSAVVLLGSIDAPNLKPPFSVLAGSMDATTGTDSTFLGSIVFPNLNPGVSFTSFGTSGGTPNLNPAEESSFLFDNPNENPVVWDEVDDDSVPNLVLVCAGWTPNLKVETADGATADLVPGRGSSQDLHRLSVSEFLTMQTEHSH